MTEQAIAEMMTGFVTGMAATVLAGLTSWGISVVCRLFKHILMEWR
jgi:hypothetical protein